MNFLKTLALAIRQQILDCLFYTGGDFGAVAIRHKLLPNGNIGSQKLAFDFFHVDSTFQLHRTYLERFVEERCRNVRKKLLYSSWKNWTDADFDQTNNVGIRSILLTGVLKCTSPEAWARVGLPVTLGIVSPERMAEWPNLTYVLMYEKPHWFSDYRCVLLEFTYSDDSKFALVEPLFETVVPEKVWHFAG